MHKPRARNSPDSSDGLAKYDLRHIFLATRGFLATDPRDKIYGVLGMTHEESRRHVTPTYRADIVSVFRDATMVLLKNERSTEIYAYLPAGRRKRFGEWFPSWIPNFAISMERPLQVFSGHLQNTKTFKQHRAEAEDIELLDGGERLRIRGLLLDTVEHIVKAPPSVPRTNTLRTLSQVVTAWVIFAYRYYNTSTVLSLARAFFSIKSIIQTRASLVELLQALVMIGKWSARQQKRDRLKEPLWKLLLLSEGNDEKYEDVAACQEKFNSLIEMSNSSIHDDAWSVDPDKLTISFNRLNLADPVKAGIQASFVQGRYVFGCENGRYGVGEGEDQLGDKLVLLFPDTNVPFILREITGCYEMIGLCYVPENVLVASPDAEFQSFILV
jgi:hypothetical protein